MINEQILEELININKKTFLNYLDLTFSDISPTSPFVYKSEEEKILKLLSKQEILNILIKILIYDIDFCYLLIKYIALKVYFPTIDLIHQIFNILNNKSLSLDHQSKFENIIFENYIINIIKLFEFKLNDDLILSLCEKLFLSKVFFLY
jgi:hypothetical protein